MAQTNQEHLKTIATEITRRLVERSVRLQFTRHSMEGAVDTDDVEFIENDMVDDALNIALGDDTGCLSDEDLTPENIDVLFVQGKLAEVERNMRDRCFHDFIRLLSSAQNDPPTEDGKEAVRCLAAGVYAQGTDGLGDGNCKCGEADCPYVQHAPASSTAA